MVVTFALIFSTGDGTRLPSPVVLAAKPAVPFVADPAHTCPGEDFNGPTNHQPSGVGQLRQSGRSQ